MIVLDNVNRSLQVILAGAKNTNDAPVVAAWEDQSASTGPSQAKVVPGENPTNTNGVTAVTLVPAPPSGYLRRVKSIALNNADLASITVSFRYYDNGTTYALYKVTLQTLEQLVYEEGSGFTAYDSNGAAKSQAAATSSATSTAQSTADKASSQASSIAALTPASTSSQASSLAAAIVPASVNSVSSQASSMAALVPASVSSQASSMQAIYATISSVASRTKSSFAW